jgi:hypothetical protein
MPTTDPERAQFITALRDLARYLSDHPDVPVPDIGKDILVFVPDGTDDEERALVDQAATALDVAVAERNGHYMASRAFGPRLSYTVLTISTAARAEHQARQSYCANITTAPAPAPAATAA